MAWAGRADGCACMLTVQPPVALFTGAEGGALSRSATRAPPNTQSPGFTRAFPEAETAAAFPPACFDLLGLDALLSPEERALRDRVRAFMVSGSVLSAAERQRRAPLVIPCHGRCRCCRRRGGGPRRGPTR